VRLPSHLASVPQPGSTAIEHSEALTGLIGHEIRAAGGWISFARYMELALYAPGLGYYSAGAAKVGAGGDFVTAPEISPLFGRTLARQVAELVASGLTQILELGAGRGALAADLLTELAQLGALPERCFLLETSADLRARQASRFARLHDSLAGRIVWIEELPADFTGVVLGNEVLDAMPFHVVRTSAGCIDELGVTEGAEGFRWQPRAAHGALLAAAQAIGLPPHYTTEIPLAARAFIRTLAAHLARGVVLMADYGFPAREYYHAERCNGTLMCHYRHRAHDDPFCLVGLQDITAHVDFSAIARVAHESALDVLGYCSQAQFLINCGITDRLAETPAALGAAYLPLAAQAAKLLSPAEMGELFKFVALGKDCRIPLIGFGRGDRRGAL
jgi:SAM-dependent MidA family methyltransferase